MGTFRAALTALAGLSVSGISANLDVDAVPDEINRGQLPALLVLPVNPPKNPDDDETGSLFDERGSGFTALAFTESTRTVTYHVNHVLLVAPLNAGSGLRSHLPALIDLIDNYFSALGADVTLGGTLRQAAQVDVQPGIIVHGGVAYVGCRLRHEWVIGY
ncbi:MAG: hypothetical protein RLP44_28025 [Aggregatilineales bacterium]